MQSLVSQAKTKSQINWLKLDTGVINRSEVAQRLTLGSHVGERKPLIFSIILGSNSLDH